MSNQTAKELQDALDAIDYDGTLNKDLPESEDFRFAGAEAARVEKNRIVLSAPNLDGKMIEHSFDLGTEAAKSALKDPHVKKLLRRPVGRPADISGKKVNTYLDAESITIATRLGKGNVSEGIRKALKDHGVAG